MYKIFFGLVCMCVFLFGLFPNDASAALRQRESAIPLKEVYNPKHDASDILLPMPCGAQMAFRIVGVPARGFLHEFETSFGTDQSDRVEEHGYYERPYTAALSGAFSVNDVPAPWRKHLPDHQTDYFYYLIGKYAATSFQWRAVMENWCPPDGQSLTRDDALPKTDISWFEAQDFARKYTEWLLQNAPEALPKFAGDSRNTGFLRLPLETEWEYAARGGHAVSMEDLSHFNPLPLDDYAVFRPEGSSIAPTRKEPIGTKKANPLGIYDMQGNVAEMVLNPFSFSIGGRLNGAGGGFTFKGGSYRSNETGIHPGRREEMAYYFIDGVTRRNDVGLRLVVSGIKTPGGERPASLAEEWKRIGEGEESRLLNQGKNPLEEIDRIIEHQTSTAYEKELNQLRDLLKDNNIALERYNNSAAAGSILSSLYMIEALKSYAIRRQMALTNITNLELELPIIDERKKQREAMLGQLTKNQTAERQRVDQLLQQDNEAQQQIAAEIEVFRNNEAALRRSLLAATAFYRDKIDENLNYPAEMMSRHVQERRREYGKTDDVHSRNMIIALDIYEGHVRARRAGEIAKLTRINILKDILPERFMQGLSEK